MTRKRIISAVTQIIVKRLVSSVTRMYHEVNHSAIVNDKVARALTTGNLLDDGISTLDPCLLSPLYDTQKSVTLT